jgi:hypothetical protein
MRGAHGGGRDNEALQELVGFLSGEIEDEEGLTVGL